MPYKELEVEYANYTGSKHGISCNTGTSALHLALMAIGVGKGDEVIVPDFTMAATTFAVSYTGAKPVFVDCGDDLLIDVSLIEKKITKKTKAIMPVHIYGRICDMEAIIDIAKRHNLKVIEDACEAQGAIYQSKADITCYSFYINKIIPAEEGGMCTTDNEEYAKRMNFLKCMSFNEDHDYTHAEIGYNYRMANSQAKFVLGGLAMANEIQLGRYRVQSWYDQYINPAYKRSDRKVVWVYDISHPKRDELVKYLNSKGINARHGFKPMSTMPMYKGKTGKKSLKYAKEIMYLPVSPLMTEEQVKEICREIDDFSI